MAIGCQVVTFSHTIKFDAFKLLEHPSVALKVLNLKNNSFDLLWDTASRLDLQSEHEYFHAHIAISSFVTALSVSSFGVFIPTNWINRVPSYKQFNFDTDERSIMTLNFRHDKRYEEASELSNVEVGNAIIIFRLLAKEEESMSRNEYIKGLIHMNINHFDITFNKEAFANFYRSLEFFIAQKITISGKMSNECKTIQGALKGLGADQVLVDEFKALYIKRSSQVMHAQVKQETLSYDDVIKMKTYADLVIHKYYLREAEKIKAGE